MNLALKPSSSEISTDTIEGTNYIVVLNWNSWRDTIECLESVLALADTRYRIVVCDNGSTDGSLNALMSWAEGRLTYRSRRENGLSHLAPSVARPIPYACLDQSTLDSHPEDSLIFIDNAENLGFAAGNNVGIRFALNQTDMSHVWLLNNDTVVEPDALLRMRERMGSDASIGCCGSLIKFYDDPSVVQAVGGCRFNLHTGVASETLGRYLPDSVPLDIDEYEAQMDYISGASMLVSREFLENVGLMEEGYFLYYEEIDWAVRAQGQYRLAIAGESVVYHKEGRSIGSASLARPASSKSELYLHRSRLRFMRLHRPLWLPVSYLTSMLQMFNRIRQGRYETAMTLARLLLGRPIG